MRKLLRISRHEFFKIVWKRGFWVGTLAFPFMILVFSLMAIFVIAFVEAEDLPDAIGYVDHADILDGVEVTGETGIGVGIRPYLTESSAQRALRMDNIQAYYVLHEDYLDTHKVTLYVQDETPTLAESTLSRLLRPRILANTDEAVRQRVLAGADIDIQTIAVDEQTESEDRSTETMVRAVILLIAFLIVIFILGDIAGYSAMIVEDERDNRTLEMMMTTMTPTQFVVGKIIGLIGVTIMRPAIWFLMATPLVLAVYFSIPPELQALIDWSFVLLILLFIIPGILLFFGLMTVASMAVNDPRYSGQMGSLLSTALIFSIFIGMSLIADEENAVAIFFSFFPLTSFMVMVMRQTMTDVPVWQISLSWLILVASALGSLWLSVRFFESGRLFTGRPFEWRALWQKLRIRRSA